ncbi:MAG: hypothetical protein NXH70_02025 [Hyphomonas sp.]|nr:hypothetical protein [Hyphomonas sp.]
MIWFSNWKYILLKDRSLFWTYLKINVRRVIYWVSLSPIFLPLLLIGFIALIFKCLGELIDGIFEMIGEGVNYLLRKTGYIKFNTRTDDCYDGLAGRSKRRRRERENAS